MMMRNENASQINSVRFALNILGTPRVSAAGQLGASGAGTISISAGDFTDWPASGWCRIETAADAEREIVYYSSRTTTALTVPAAGRGLLGTSAAAGAADDNIYPVPGIRLAKEAPSADAIQTIASETTAPTGVTWNSAIRLSDGLQIGNLASLAKYGLWVHRQIPAGAAAIASMLNLLQWDFDA